MNKRLKVIFSMIGLLCIVQFVFIFFLLFSGDSVASATRRVLVASISSEDAKEIALDYIGYGLITDVALITENDVQIYTVAIKQENVHFVIYVHGQTGDVVRMVRTEDGYQGIMTLPEILSPDDLLDLELD